MARKKGHKHKSNTDNKTWHEQYNPSPILFYVFIQRWNGEGFFYANQHNIQATEKDGHADGNQMYSTIHCQLATSQFT